MEQYLTYGVIFLAMVLLATQWYTYITMRMYDDKMIELLCDMHNKLCDTFKFIDKHQKELAESMIGIVEVIETAVKRSTKDVTNEKDNKDKRK